MSKTTPTTADRSLFVVDDDPDICALLEHWLRDLYAYRSFASSTLLYDAMKNTSPSAICLDLNLEGESGLDVLSKIKSRHPHIPVIMITAEKDLQKALECVQAGALDYLTKPLTRESVLQTIRMATQSIMPFSQHSNTNSTLELPAGLIAESPTMVSALRKVIKIASSDISVVLRGETGSGKERIAQTLHEASPRNDKPFIALNCAAIADGIQDSLLFGHERGAFSGATHTHKGFFEEADGGTLFLDEVAELNLDVQAKLLRVLQEQCFQRVGGRHVYQSDFRIVAASHKALADEVEAGRFREDLMYRLNVVEIQIPALRERPEDIDPLIDHFITKYTDSTAPKLAIITRALLNTYTWPGNIRELQNTIQEICVLYGGQLITPKHLPTAIQRELLAAQHEGNIDAQQVSAATEAPLQRKPDDSKLDVEACLKKGWTLEDLEAWGIRVMLEHVNGNISELTRRLGIGRTTLYRKLKDYGLRNDL